jgi:putative spermidine/putrescine transport system substrate-binding protein
MQTMKLRRAVSALAGAVVVLGVSAGTATAGKFDGVTLVVGTFGGSWKDRICEYICPKFEAEGGKIEFVSGNPRSLLSKMVAARGQDAPMDVIETVDSTWPETLKAEFVQKYDPANIPNLKNLDKTSYDAYKVGNWITEEGFLFDVKKFSELGLPRPTKWTDLMNEKLAGRVALPDIEVSTILNPIVGFSIEAGSNENDIQPGLDSIAKIKVHSFWSSGTQLTQLFKAGDIWAAAAHAGWGVRLSDGGVDVGFVHPDLGGKGRGMAATGYAAITAGSKNKAAAEFYINHLISDEMQEVLHTKNGIVPTSTNIQNKYSDPSMLKSDSTGVPFLLMKPADIAGLYRMDSDKVDLKDWTRKWNRTIPK